MDDRDGIACGHAEAAAAEAAERHQRKNAAGVGPRRNWKKVGVLVGAATAIVSGLLSAQSNRTITIQVTETTGIRRTEYPTIARLQLTRAALADAAHVKLRSNDADIPAQFTIVSKWDDGSVRAVDVDFNVSIGPAESRTYQVEHGPDVAAAAPARGLMVAEAADAIQIGNVKFGKTGSPLILSASYRGEFMGSGSNGAVIIDAAGRRHDLTTAQALKVDLIKRGPLVATVQFTGRVPIDAAYAVPFTITCEMPSSKSWIKTTIAVDDTGPRVTTLALDSPLTFGDKPWTWDFSTPNGTYGAFRNPADTALLKQVVGVKGGNTWTVQTGAENDLRAYESSTAGRGATVAGWGHMLDATRAAAFGVDKFASEPGTYTISLSGQGQARFAVSPAQSKTQHTLTVYQHFVTTPVPIGAATSPTAMLNPLVVVVKQ